MTERAEVLGDHAVVVGASVAGLLAARALAENYERVTIVERDELPAVGEGRRAVPQGRHAHALLESGRRAIEELLPGISDELFAAGAVSCRSLAEMRLVIAGHELCREARGADALLAGRPLIEGHIRRRVSALTNVAVRERSDAVEPLSRGGVVTGVRVRPRDGGAVEDVEADLVVSAGGRAGAAAAWLESLGLPQPEMERLRVDVKYASRRVRIPTGALEQKLIGVGARPGHPRGMFLIAQEDDHWILTAFGYGASDHAPTDDEGHLEFLATVAPPDVMAAIRRAEPLGEIVTHGFPANQRRRFERVREFPRGLLVIGDAISSFNPLYGQGMSVAALEAVELRRCLAEGDEDLTHRYFGAVTKVVDHAWEMATGGDLALPEVEGDRSFAVRLTNAYIERLLRVAERDPIVAATFNEVGDLLAPPQAVLHPRILWRVARGNLLGARANGAAVAAGRRHAAGRTR